VLQGSRMIRTRKASRREIFGWAMFDFANQAYTLLIITVVFGDIYTRIVVGDAPGYRLGNLLWSAALCLSYAIVVVSAPLLGAVMDHAQAKKRLLFASYVLTVASTGMLYFVEPGHVWLGFVLIVLSNAAYSAGESFIASFLPFLGDSTELGRISGYGWALGYAGGSGIGRIRARLPGRGQRGELRAHPLGGPLRSCILPARRHPDLHLAARTGLRSTSHTAARGDLQRLRAPAADSPFGGRVSRSVPAVHLHPVRDGRRLCDRGLLVHRTAR